MRSALIGPSVLLAALWLSPGVAAADGPTYPPTQPTGSPVTHTDFVGGTTGGAVTGQTKPSGATHGGLPFTGADVALLALAGGASVAAGTVLAAGSRKRRASGS